jgi:nucleoside-diphosphate-sugar epimerase
MAIRRVLVTGSQGFIGKWVREELVERGIEPIGFDHPRTILNTSDLQHAIGRVDAVVNLAGVLGTPEIFGSEREAAMVNIIGAINVFDLAACDGIPVVQIGTGHKGQPNPYAITKAAAEDIGLCRAQYLGEHITVVRAFHVYGEGQKAPAPHGASNVRKIIPSFACRALSNMDIEVTGDGSQLIDLVYAQDVARVLVDALAAPPGSILQAGTGKPISVLQAAHDVRTWAGSTSRIVHTPPRIGEPEGAVVVADQPLCDNPWPHRLAETVTWYRDTYIK